MKIPIEEAKDVIFIDTYNNWQILLQTKEKVFIYAFDRETTSLTLRKTFNFKFSYPLKQAAHLKDSFFTLNHMGEFQVNNETKQEKCESFLVLASGHFLLIKSDRLILLNDGNETEIKLKRPIAVLPFVNCLTVLHLDEKTPNFSLNAPVQSKFLLPDLFFASPIDSACNLLSNWIEDPLYQLALEYILLGSLGKQNLLKALDETHRTNHFKMFSSAIISLTRKIEVHEASQKLFQYLPSFTPLFVVKSLKNSVAEIINFLPYLAKSYFESVDERKEAIALILEVIFNRAKPCGDLIRKVKEYLTAFSDLEALFEETIKVKIESLWKSGRLIKAFSLMKYSNCTEWKFLTIPDSKYARIEIALFPDLVPEFRAWLATTQSNPKTVADHYL